MPAAEVGARLRVRGLALAYRPAGLPEVSVLAALDLDVAAAEIVAVTGVSGSGKSTLLHALGGMLRPDAGAIELEGVDPWRLGAAERAAWRNRRLGFVFQSPRLLAELSAVENVALPQWIAGVPRAEADAAAAAALGALGLEGRLHHRPAELSGGEAQRVAVARALVRRPALVLADEPTGNLDREAARGVLGQIARLRETLGFSAVLATHDMDLAAACDRVLVVRGGRIDAAGGRAAARRGGP